jgi:3-oxoacyl-[acyl-carrier protein] reductase
MSNLNAFDLTGKIAVVTGSSSGIGRAIAIELAAGGADVLVHAGSNRTGADETADEVRRLGRQSQVQIANFADPQAVDEFTNRAWKWQGHMDVWVNNAGADTLIGAAAQQDFDEKLDRLWQIDVLSTVRAARIIGAKMRSRGSGCIINIGWDQAETGMAGDSGELFATTKGAIMSFTRSLAKSLAPKVRVNCIAPGWIKTAWGEQASDVWQQRAGRESLLQRWGTPEDVARVARFLASPAAAFVTGQIIAVNGGRA